MPASTAKLETFVSPEELKEVILDFEAYPSFMKEVTRVEVHDKTDERADVTFHIDIGFGGFEIKSFYRVEYVIDGLSMRWSLKESPTITKNEGSWTLEETDDEECVATFESEIEINLAIPPEVQQAFTEQELPKLMEAIRDRAEGM